MTTAHWRRKVWVIICLVLTAVVAASCGGTPAPSSGTGAGTSSESPSTSEGSSGDDVIYWRLSVWGAPRAWTFSVEDWAEAMKERTNGRFVVEIFYGEQLGPASEQLDGLRAGLFEAGGVAPFYTPGKLPLNQVMDLPFISPITNEDLVRFQMAAWEHPALLAELENWNTVPLLPSIPSQYQAMGRTRIEKAEDFAGVRISGMSADQGKVFAKFGAVPTPMPAPEVYNALERGTVDTAIFPSWYGHGSYKFYEVSKYALDGLNAGSPSSFFLANKDAWDALPDDIKAIHMEIYNEWPTWSAKYYEQEDAKWLPIFQEELEEIIVMDPAERQKLVDAAEEVWEEWIEQWADRGPTREILEYMLERRREIAGF